MAFSSAASVALICGPLMVLSSPVAAPAMLLPIPVEIDAVDLWPGSSAAERVMLSPPRPTGRNDVDVASRFSPAGGASHHLQGHDLLGR